MLPEELFVQEITHFESWNLEREFCKPKAPMSKDWIFFKNLQMNGEFQMESHPLLFLIFLTVKKKNLRSTGPRPCDWDLNGLGAWVDIT